MKISQAIKKLEKIKKERGNIEISINISIPKEFLINEPSEKAKKLSKLWKKRVDSATIRKEMGWSPSANVSSEVSDYRYRYGTEYFPYSEDRK